MTGKGQPIDHSADITSIRRTDHSATSPLKPKDKPVGENLETRPGVYIKPAVLGVCIVAAGYLIGSIWWGSRVTTIMEMVEKEVRLTKNALNRSARESGELKARILLLERAIEQQGKKP